MFKNRLEEMGEVENRVGGVMGKEKKDERRGGLFDGEGFGKRGDREFVDVNSGGNTFPMFKKKPLAVNQQ